MPALRILLVDQGGRGGVADYTLQLAQALAGEGLVVDYATATDHHHPPDPSIRFRRLFPYVRGRNAFTRMLRALGLGRIINGVAHAAALVPLLALAMRADVVHIQGNGELPPLNVAFMRAARAARRPMVWTPHNTFERHGQYQRSADAMYELADQVIVHAEADLANLPAAARDRSSVIPHGEYGTLARGAGAAPTRDAARVGLEIAPDAFVALLFGHLRTDKGLGDLLRAAEEVAGVHVLVAGEDRGALAAEAGALERLRRAGQVTVREGFVSMDVAAGFFAAADVVVLPYSRASQSGVLLLAYGFDRPVIVYPVGGLPEAVVDGETGWVCVEPTPQALAASLGAAAGAGTDEAHRRGVAGAGLAATRFAWPAIARQTIPVYDAAISGRRPR